MPRGEPLEDRAHPTATLWAPEVPALPDAWVGGAAVRVAVPSPAPAAAFTSLSLSAPLRSPVAADRREVVLVAFDLPDRDALVQDLLALPSPGTSREVVIFSGGVRGITDILARRAGVDGIHLLSHGAAGAVAVGPDRLDLASLAAHEADLRAWGAALNPGGDLLLYGCDVAAGGGRAFVAGLARLTGADVAASTDRTGAGGGADWVLEHATGAIESAPLAAPGWGHALPLVSFRQSVNGYAGTHDTFIDIDNPTATHGGEDNIYAEGGAENLQALIRFDGIIGTGPGQIPPGATIHSARLEVYVTNAATATVVSFHRMLVPWAESSSWASLGNGVQLDDAEARATADAVFRDTGNDKQRFVTGFTEAVQAWADGAPNYGWVLVSDNAKWGMYSSEKGGASNPRLVVTYTVTNRAPVVPAVGYTTAEDAPLVVPAAAGLLAAAADPDGDSLTAALVSGPAHGVAAVNPDGSFTYTPAPDYSGPDSFTYAVSDGRGGTTVGTVTLTVTPVNDAPVARDDRYTTNVNLVVLTVPLAVAAPGVLANDADADGDPLTAQLFTGTSNGLLSFNPDGSFTYTAVLNFTGTDSFTYRVFDGTAWSAPATVVITVAAANQPPAATADAYTTAEDTPLVVPAPGLLANDADPDGDTLFVVLDAGPTRGTLALRPDGSFTYTPGPDWSGTDSFAYHVSDGSRASAAVTVTLTVTAVDDPPTLDPIPDRTISEDAPPVTVTLGGIGAGGGEAQPLTVTATSSDPALIPDPTVTYTSPATTAVLRYQPVADRSGTATITVTVSDGANTVTRTFTVTVRAANDAPAAADDSAATDAGAAVTVAVLANDTDPDGDALAVVAVGAAANGTVTTDGVTITYTPAAGWSGTDTFTYTISDGGGGTATATVTVVVRPATAPPVDPAPVDPTPVEPLPVDPLPIDPIVEAPVPTDPTPPQPTPDPVTPPVGTPAGLAETTPIGGGIVELVTTTVTGATGGVKPVTTVAARGETGRGPTILETGRVFGAADAPAGGGGAPEAPAPRAAPAPTPDPVPAQPSPAPPAASALPPAPPTPFVAPAPAVTIPVADATPPAAVLAAIDEVRSELRADASARATTDTLVVSGGVAVAGYALLNTRAVYWFLSALLARPAVWRRFDPLDVVYAWERDQTAGAPGGDESLQSMVG